MAYTSTGMQVARSYFTLMELLMRSHTASIVELDARVLRHLCVSLTEGVKSHEVAISSQYVLARVLCPHIFMSAFDIVGAQLRSSTSLLSASAK